MLIQRLNSIYLSHVSNITVNILYKVQLKDMHYNLHKHFFTNRIVAQ